METSPLVKKYGDQKIWLNWKPVKKANGKIDKVPLGSSTDEKTWKTFREVFKRDPKHIGIVLQDKKLTCIDMDHVLEDGKIVGEYSEVVATLILEGCTFTEISQSNTGLHMFFETPEPYEIITKKKIPTPFEVYNSGRFIAVTGNKYNDCDEIREIPNQEAWDIINYAVPQIAQEISEDTDTTTKEILTDAEIVRRLLSREDTKKVYNCDDTKFGGDKSSGDISLLNKLAYYTRKNPTQMERIFLASPRGTKEMLSRKGKGKEKGIKDYLKRSIDKAILFTKKVYEDPANGFELITTQDKQGNIKYVLNTENISRILSQHKEFAGKIRYETFQNKLQIKKGNEFVEIQDNDIIQLQTKISVMFPFFAQVSKEMTRDAVDKVSYENQVDEAIEYITSLTWDRKPRLDQWLQNVYGVRDNEYHRRVGSNWMKGLVNRIVNPGCKFDYVLVVEGEQGAKKSTSFIELVGQQWHSEIIASTDNKDFFMAFAGKAVIEFSEGEVLSRTDIKRMKSIITNQTDRYRKPFERSARDYPRRCVFVMTTNDDEYLRDETGNRRWLPVKTVYAEANIEWIRENREQMLAEAYHRVIVMQETTWEFPKDETLEEQQKRTVKSANEEIVIDWYFNTLTETEREAGITIAQVYQKCFNTTFSSKQMKKGDEMEISRILKGGMSMEQRRTRVAGMQTTKYYQKKVLSEIQREQLAPNDNF